MSNIDIELYNQKSEINTNPPEIIIEISGLKSLNKFIGLDDTPTYYENGKFFKVIDNRIEYTDINWEDIKGDIEKNPELQQEILRLIEENAKQYTQNIVDNSINTHDKNENAHPYIQNIIEQNHEELNNKIELNKIDTNQKINEANSRIDTNKSNIDRLDTFTQEVNANLENLTLEVQVDIKGDISKLQDDLQTTNQEVVDNFTILDTKIDNTKSELNNTISDNYTTLDNKITENYNNLDLRVSTNTQDIADLTQVVEDDFQEVNTHITDLNTRVTNNTNNITALDTKIDNVNNTSIKDIVYDKLAQKFTLTFGDTTTKILTLEELLTGASYDGDTGNFTFTKANGESVIINTPKENFLSDVQYNSETKTITFIMTSGSTFEVNISDLIDVYTVKSTNSVNMNMTSEGEISSDIKISSESGNILSVKSDGVYGDVSTLATKTELVDGLATKQDTLTAGNNIEITDDNTVNNTMKIVFRDWSV